jgi:hypothetical protein
MPSYTGCHLNLLLAATAHILHFHQDQVPRFLDHSMLAPNSLGLLQVNRAFKGKALFTMSHIPGSQGRVLRAEHGVIRR